MFLAGGSSGLLTNVTKHGFLRFASFHIFLFLASSFSAATYALMPRCLSFFMSAAWADSFQLTFDRPYPVVPAFPVPG
jgi:hypothetical protein